MLNPNLLINLLLYRALQYRIEVNKHTHTSRTTRDDDQPRKGRTALSCHGMMAVGVNPPHRLCHDHEVNSPSPSLSLGPSQLRSWCTQKRQQTDDENPLALHGHGMQLRRAHSVQGERCYINCCINIPRQVSVGEAPKVDLSSDETITLYSRSILSFTYEVHDIGSQDR